MKKMTLIAALAATTVLAGSLPAMAEYPDAPVQFIVPWPPGDFEDILTRMIAAKMEEMHGISATVVNKPGGGDGPFPGALEVLDGPIDGSVVGSFILDVPLIGPLIDIGMEEDSFEPVGIFLTYPFVLASSGDTPYKSMAELAAYAQDNDVILGHFGEGLTPTTATFAAAKMMGFEYADDAAFDLLDCNTLAAGDADVINTTLALIEPCLGELNVLANIGNAPIERLSGVETLAAQSGIADIELWNGLFVKAGTPQDVIDVLAEVAEAAMATEEAQTLMAETGARVYWQDAEMSAARITVDRATSKKMNALLGE